MKNHKYLLLALTPLIWTAPALAQDATTESAVTAETESEEAIDPARLAAASALMDILIPQQGEAEWAASFITPAMDNALITMTESTEFKAMIEAAPRSRDVLDRFFARVRSVTVETATSDLPTLRNAMAAAHARQFTVVQIEEIAAFMSTPTGRAYNIAAPRLLADEDVARWQRSVLVRNQEALAPILQQFITEMASVAVKADSLDSSE